MEIELKTRKMDVTLELSEITSWNNNDIVATQWFNACSTLFPIGERMFIDSVRHFQPLVKDPLLQKQIKGFIHQEAMHSSFHLRYNKVLRDKGYNIDFMDRHYHTFIKYAYYFFNDKMKLAITAACEHITASLGDIIYHQKLLAGAKENFATLWKTHIIEEIEHKAVAFDTLKYLEIGYFTRISAMFIAYIEFTSRVSFRQVVLLFQEGCAFNPKIWWQIIKYKWGKKGINRLLLLKTLQYFKIKFHPWDYNNYHIVKAWEPKDRIKSDEENSFVPVSKTLLARVGSSTR